ncbi:hypothetical protein GUJ93_ZPchr0013g34307 [Zizania palustris]|uniref:Uncharacterized protein n=1 Tax=Zizania palustris TaxID=103762 RepID=A0A8J6BYJ7_ZIZPA|nr:hypothetical protein GUJ93_ZPchr0013g34307 [Zizania palustris]
MAFCSSMPHLHPPLTSQSHSVLILHPAHHIVASLKCHHPSLHRNTAKQMDDHNDDGLRDLFSQPDSVFPATGYDFFSWAESSQAHRAGMHALDLNSQAEDFTNITSYSKMLRGDGFIRDCTSGTLGLCVPHNGERDGGRVIRGGGHARSLFGGRRGGSLAEGAASGGGGRGGSMAQGGAGGGDHGRSITEGGAGSRGHG